ncbi:MAG: TonB-dependent receptor plug domain-containing protein [Cytophagales bacterium]|nr:TonB-dependent receptor plug domain-containing protein [Cytophagales bacterium]
MKKLASIICFLVLCTFAQAQEKFIYGYILEQKDASIIPEGATLSLRDSTGITEPIQKKSNKFNGYFELLVEERFETLIISKDGYETKEVNLIELKGLIPQDSLSLIRNLQLDLRAYPSAQSNSFISTGLEVKRKIDFADGTAETTTLFGEDDAIQAIVLTQSESQSDSLLITSEVYEDESISIAEYFNELPASDRINFILADTLKAVEKLFFQQGISTAGKRNQSIGQIPASVVIVSKEEIAAQGYQSVPEILENVTGLYLFRDYSWSGGDPIVGMRGFFSQGFNNDIIILVNGVNMYEEYWGFYPFSRFPIGVEAIDRIEIVRGPMSVLYGSGAFFGAINIITNAPLDKEVTDEEILPKHLALSYGSRDTRRLSGGLKYKKDRVSFAFNTNITLSDGLNQPFSRFLHDTTNVSVANAISNNPALRSTTEAMLPVEQRYVSASLNLQDKAGLTQYSVDLTASSENRGVFESTAASSNTFCQCPIPQANPNAPGILNRSSSAYGGIRVTHSPRDNNLNLNLNLFFHEFSTEIDYTAGGNRFGLSSFLSKAFELEGSASKSWDRLSGIVGVNARTAVDLFTAFDFPNDTLGGGNDFIRLDGNSELNLFSAFGEFEYEVVKNKVFVTAGGRLEQLSDFDFLSDAAINTTDTIPDNLVFPPNSSSITGIKPVFIPRAAVVLNINPTNFLKFLFGEARKRPSFGNFTDNNALSFPLIRTLELNFIRESKINPDSKIRSSLNASFYRNEIENLISRISSTRNGQSVFGSSNARNVTTYGAEIGFLLQEPSKWSIEVSGSYNQSDEIQELTETLSVEDSTASFSPVLLAYLKGSYYWSLKPFDLQLGLNSRYISSSRSEFTLDEGVPRRLGQTVPSYVVTNMNIRFSPSSLKEDHQRNKFRNLYIALNITNMFDVDIQYPTTGNNESWAIQGSPGFGRRFFLTLGIDI